MLQHAGSWLVASTLLSLIAETRTTELASAEEFRAVKAAVARRSEDALNQPASDARASFADEGAFATPQGGHDMRGVRSDGTVSDIAVKSHAASVPFASVSIDPGPLGVDDGATKFQHFVAKYGRTYAPDSEEYLRRRQIFEGHVKEIDALNARHGQLWQAEVNHFSDRTDDELKKYRGYRHQSRRGEVVAATTATTGALISNSSTSTNEQDTTIAVPKEKMWTHLNNSRYIRDQGECGSCWALATIGVLGARYELRANALHGKERNFSAQELVSCVENPQQCGGQGGCSGATMELGMDYIMQHLIAQEEENPYSAHDGKCKRIVLDEQGSSRSGRISSTKRAGGSAAEMLGLTGFKALPTNKLEPLLLALMDGPVGVSVAAGGWHYYARGIYDMCDRDAVVDHAVVLYGYGEAKVGPPSHMEKYWLIQNSWGPAWGEASPGSKDDKTRGFIRMKRHEDSSYCGVDSKPELGSGCKGGPEKVTVCGMCGILYDAVAPLVSHDRHVVAAPVTKQVPQQNVSLAPTGGKINHLDPIAAAEGPELRRRTRADSPKLSSPSASGGILAGNAADTEESAFRRHDGHPMEGNPSEVPLHSSEGRALRDLYDWQHVGDGRQIAREASGATGLQQLWVPRSTEAVVDPDGTAKHFIRREHGLPKIPAKARP